MSTLAVDRFVESSETDYSNESDRFLLSNFIEEV
tara:strand:+ start:79 stop:180 length:102 start_codon:yes stop_codon:yes gene_type:complete